MNPKISIITPIYNSERFISECLESSINQTYTNWEQILVDDCSTDNSVQLIEAYIKRDNRIRLIKLSENVGSGPARNKAIESSTGKIIAFLDSDDIWEPNKLERHVKFMIDNNAAFSHTSYGFINESGNIVNKTYHVSNRPIGYQDLLKRAEISCLTAMYSVEKLGKIYMPDLRRKQDYALWLSILKRGIKSIPLDETLAYYRQVKGSATNNKSKLILKHIVFLYKHEKIGLVNTIYYFGWYAINGFKKYYVNRVISKIQSNKSK